MKLSTNALLPINQGYPIGSVKRYIPKNSYIKIDMEYALRELAYNYDPDTCPYRKTIVFFTPENREKILNRPSF